MVNDKEKILLTGASGFVGKAVREELERTGRFEISGFAGGGRRRTAEDFFSDGRLYEVDIADYRSFPDTGALENTRVVIHCAGLAHQFGPVGREDFQRVNVRGTENVCRLAEAIGAIHLILLSSVAVYGKHGDAEIIDEKFSCQPEGFYAESKLEAERRAIEFCEKHKIPLTVLRPATVIGEGDRGNTARLITQIDRNRFFWIGDGTNKKTLVYKGDVAKSILKIIEAGAPAGLEIYNLAAPPVAMREIVETICRQLGKKALPVSIPEKWVRGAFGIIPAGLRAGKLAGLESMVEKWLASDIYSGRKFSERFGFRLPTPVTRALVRQVSWYEKQKDKNSEQ